MSSSANPARGYALVFAGALFFVVNAGVSRTLQAAGVDSMTLTSVRCTGTALVLVAVIIARGERIRRPSSWREVLAILGFALSGVALVQYLYFIALDRLPVGIALLIEFTAPLLVALFARFVYAEPVRRRMWLALALALGGLALVAEVWDGMTLDVVGVLAAAGAAVSLATYFLIGEHSVSSDPPLHVLTKAFVIAAIAWNVFAPVTRLGDLVELTGGQSLGGNLADVHAQVWALVVWLVVLGTVVPFLLELTALRHLSATEVTLAGMLEPVGATVLGWLWYSEALSGWQVIGMVTVLAGIALAQSARRPVDPTAGIELTRAV